MRSLVLVATLVLLGCAPARAGDPLPYFRPDRPPVLGPTRPHPIATECAINDRECVDEHDLRALDIALLCAEAADVGCRDLCNGATDPCACRRTYDLILDVQP